MGLPRLLATNVLLERGGNARVGQQQMNFDPETCRKKTAKHLSFFDMFLVYFPSAVYILQRYSYMYSDLFIYFHLSGLKYFKYLFEINTLKKKKKRYLCNDIYF